MILSHKIALDPNLAQRKYCAQGAGTARFAWNWALHEWKTAYEAGEKVTEGGLRKKLNATQAPRIPMDARGHQGCPAACNQVSGHCFQKILRWNVVLPPAKEERTQGQL